MNRKGPILTLLAGLVVAGIFVALYSNAASKEKSHDVGKGTQVIQPPDETPSPEPPTASPSPSAPAQAKLTYAGKVNGAAATLALAVRDGKAVAYVCDGRRIESWLQGTASGGQLNLNGPGGSTVRGTVGGGRATGNVTVAGKRWSFIAPVARPGGLYRAAQTVGNASIVGSWIVLPDGTQVGIVTVDRQPSPAPQLNTSSLTATVNGETITARQIDGTGL